MIDGGGGGRQKDTAELDDDAPADLVPDKCNPIDAQVGQQLKAFRIMRGLSQPELARPLGVTFQQLQKYERGENRLSSSKLYLAAAALKVRVDGFFEGLPDPTQGDETDEALLVAQREMVAFLAEPDGRDLALNLPKLSRPLRAHVAGLVRAMAADVPPEDVAAG